MTFVDKKRERDEFKYLVGGGGEARHEKYIRRKVKEL